MSWLWLLLPLGVSSYTFSYGLEIWRQGNRRGAWGVWSLVIIILGLAVYLIFFHRE